MEKKTDQVLETIVQSNILIESRYNLSAAEIKLVLLVISKIKRKDTEFKPYKIHISDFLTMVGTKRTSIHTDAKAISKAVLSKPIEIKNGKKTIQCNWLSSAVYQGGKSTIECRFDPVLMPYLLKLKECFTQFEIENIIQLKSSYSIRLYQLLKSYEKLGKRKIEYEELRWMLEIKENKYKRFCDFKKRVLEPSKKEIDAICDISFTYEVGRKGRYVHNIAFKIQRDAEKATEIENGKKAKKAIAKNKICAGMIIQIGDNTHTIKEGNVILFKNSAMPEGQINQLINSGKAKIISNLTTTN